MLKIVIVVRICVNKKWMACVIKAIIFKSNQDFFMTSPTNLRLGKEKIMYIRSTKIICYHHQISWYPLYPYICTIYELSGLWRRFSPSSIERKSGFNPGICLIIIGRWIFDEPTVLILDGNSEIGAHVRINNLYNLICLRQLIRSRAVTNRIFFSKRPIFLHVCVTCSELPSNMRTSERDWRNSIQPSQIIDYRIYWLYNLYNVYLYQVYMSIHIWLYLDNSGF